MNSKLSIKYYQDYVTKHGDAVALPDSLRYIALKHMSVPSCQAKGKVQTVFDQWESCILGVYAFLCAPTHMAMKSQCTVLVSCPFVLNVQWCTVYTL